MATGPETSSYASPAYRTSTPRATVSTTLPKCSTGRDSRSKPQSAHERHGQTPARPPPTAPHHAVVRLLGHARLAVVHRLRERRADVRLRHGPPASRAVRRTAA